MTLLTRFRSPRNLKRRVLFQEFSYTRRIFAFRGLKETGAFGKLMRLKAFERSVNEYIILYIAGAQ